MEMLAVQVSTLKPPLPLHIAVQANVPQPIPLRIQDASSQMLLHPGPIPNPIHITSPPPCTSLNWADDAESLPISLPILPSHPPPRDLSVLCSSSRKPFASLQRRDKRSQANFSQSFRNRQPFIMPRQTFSRRRFRLPHFSTTPFWPDQVQPHRTPRFSPSSTLNWDGDPRLFELSRALNALGWVRP